MQISSVLTYITKKLELASDDKVSYLYVLVISF
jgi:hypothetical protein